MPVSRAYVGLSAPVGYDYARPAEKAESDLSSSPNPILVGVTGLLVLFDEIRFACPSVCPQSMRGLDYVKFLGAERPDIALDEAQVEAVLDAEARAGGRSVGLNDIHPGGYGAFMNAYYGMTGSDNHTHGIDCFGAVVNGNPDSRNLVRDLLVLDRLEGDFFCVMNGLTRCMTFPDGLEWIRNTPEQEAVRLADRALSIASIYDLTGPEGPYHPVLEELRNHSFIAAFRTWARGTTLALHNRLVEEVAEELDAVTGEFARTALRKAVGSGGLKEASLDFIEGVAMDLLPGASTAKTALDMVTHGTERQSRRVSSFVAESRGALWEAHQRTRLHLY